MISIIEEYVMSKFMFNLALDCFFLQPNVQPSPVRSIPRIMRDDAPRAGMPVQSPDLHEQLAILLERTLTTQDSIDVIGNVSTLSDDEDIYD